FISYAFSNSIGHSVLTGGSVRYRLYSSWDVSGEDISKVIAVCSLTFWIGFLTLGSVLFLTQPLTLPSSSIAHFVPPRLIGAVCAVGVAAYLFLLHFKRGSFLELFGWRFPVPTVLTGLEQITISCFDWGFSAAVLYVLIPPSPNLNFTIFLAI